MKKQHEYSKRSVKRYLAYLRRQGYFLGRKSRRPLTIETKIRRFNSEQKLARNKITMDDYERYAEEHPREFRSGRLIHCSCGFNWLSEGIPKNCPSCNRYLAEIQPYSQADIDAVFGKK